MLAILRSIRSSDTPVARRARDFRRWALTAVALGLLTATISPTQAQEPVVSHPLTFGETTVLPASDQSGSLSDTCTVPCGEPMMAIAPDGTIWVSVPRALVICCNPQASPLWKSGDGGRTWEGPIFPDWAGGDATDVLTGADTQIVIDKRGTVYVGEAWLGSDTMHISRDGGQSWITSPIHHYDAVIDREWLAYSTVDDTIYGFYDSLTHYEFVKADLTGPAGQYAALLFPDEKPIGQGYDPYPCVVGNCVSVRIPGIPFMHGPPGWLTVDQGDGTVYVPFTGELEDESGVGVAVSTDRGATFDYRFIPGSGMDTIWIFSVAAVDEGGNLYISWGERRDDRVNVYLAVSPDQGQTWRGPFSLSEGVDGTAVFPAIAAGAEGRVAVAWFGADPVGLPDEMNATWDVNVAMSIDALSEEPTFEVAPIEEAFHQGSIWTGGSGDRRLLDFFDVDLDPETGAVLATYARDKGEGTELAFTRQLDGCSLTRLGEFIGPGVDAPPGTPPTQC